MFSSQRLSNALINGQSVQAFCAALAKPNTHNFYLWFSWKLPVKYYPRCKLKIKHWGWYSVFGVYNCVKTQEPSFYYTWNKHWFFVSLRSMKILQNIADVGMNVKDIQIGLHDTLSIRFSQEFSVQIRWGEPWNVI